MLFKGQRFLVNLDLPLFGSLLTAFMLVFGYSGVEDAMVMCFLIETQCNEFSWTGTLMPVCRFSYQIRGSCSGK